MRIWNNRKKTINEVTHIGSEDHDNVTASEPYGEDVHIFFELFGLVYVNFVLENVWVTPF